MTSRRMLMQSGLAATAAALVPFRFASSTPLVEAVAVPPAGMFVFDERFPDSVAAGQAFLRAGARLVSAREIFTRLWYDELDLRWRRKPMSLAGVTTGHVLHVLETLALDRRMLVVERAHFGSAGDGLVRWTIAPARGA